MLLSLSFFTQIGAILIVALLFLLYVLLPASAAVKCTNTTLISFVTVTCSSKSHCYDSLSWCESQTSFYGVVFLKHKIEKD